MKTTVKTQPVVSLHTAAQQATQAFINALAQRGYHIKTVSKLSGGDGIKSEVEVIRRDDRPVTAFRPNSRPLSPVRLKFDQHLSHEEMVARLMDYLAKGEYVKLFCETSTEAPQVKLSIRKITGTCLSVR